MATSTGNQRASRTRRSGSGVVNRNRGLLDVDLRVPSTHHHAVDHSAGVSCASSIPLGRFQNSPPQRERSPRTNTTLPLWWTRTPAKPHVCLRQRSALATRLRTRPNRVNHGLGWLGRAGPGAVRARPRLPPAGPRGGRPWPKGTPTARWSVARTTPWRAAPACPLTPLPVRRRRVVSRSHQHPMRCWGGVWRRLWRAD